MPKEFKIKTSSKEAPYKVSICGPPTDDHDDEIIEEDYEPTPRAAADQIPFLCLQYGAGGKAAIETRTNALGQMIIKEKQTIKDLKDEARKMCSSYKINPLTIAASIYPQIYNPIEHDTLIHKVAEKKTNTAVGQDVARIRIDYLTAEKKIIKCATELNIIQLLHVNAKDGLYLYQILEANINSIVNAANDYLQNRNGEGLRSFTDALDLGIDTFSYIAETCATILEKLSHHETVTGWKTQIDEVLRQTDAEGKQAVLCTNNDGPVQLASLNPASGQKVLYNADSIHPLLRNCAKFSVNRVLFSRADEPVHERKRPKVQLTFDDNEVRLGRFALQSGNGAFKISLSGGNFVAIKAAKYWVKSKLNQAAAGDPAAEQAQARVASQLVAATGLIQLSQMPEKLRAGKPHLTEAAAAVINSIEGVDFGAKQASINSNTEAAETMVHFSQQGVVFDPTVMQAAQQLVAGKQPNGGGRKRVQKGGAVSIENVFEMANKVSDLDLKFVCIDKTIVQRALAIHMDGDPGFGLCRTKVNNGEFIDLSIPIFSRNPILALIIHNTGSDMAKTIAELAYIVSMNPLEPKAPTRMIRLDFLKDIDPSSKTVAIQLLTDAYAHNADPVIQTAIGIINSDEEPAQLLQQLQAAAQQAQQAAAGAGSIGGGKKRIKKRTNKKTNKKKRTNKKNKRSKRKNKRSKKSTKKK